MVFEMRGIFGCFADFAEVVHDDVETCGGRRRIDGLNGAEPREDRDRQTDGVSPLAQGKSLLLQDCFAPPSFGSTIK